MRGNPRQQPTASLLPRSIPACAGEPAIRYCPAQDHGVYPRVCGGTAGMRTERPADGGLSPRVRGNPASGRMRPERPGSIPACAGEPVAAAGVTPTGGVYPRVCGGTLEQMTQVARARGLSPRVRGNRAAPRRKPGPGRSIPACAGEPTAWAGLRQSGRVYPRVCGGTAVRLMVAVVISGLSPRVRGNRQSCPGRR